MFGQRRIWRPYVNSAAYPSYPLLEQVHDKARQASSGTAGEPSAFYEDLLELLVEFQKVFQKYAEPVLKFFPSEGPKICAFTDSALAVLIGFVRLFLFPRSGGFIMTDEMKSPGNLWKKVEGPSAGLVQEHFVAQRQEALSRRTRNVEELVARTLARHPKLSSLKLKGDKWLSVYETINGALQMAPLTINFSAQSWFRTPNPYNTYAQVYERSGLNDAGTPQLAGSNLNPAQDRARIDDQITFNNLAGVSPQRGPQRGLAPGRQGLDRIKAQMEFKPSSQSRSVRDVQTGRQVGYVDSTNPRFNPKTKQVFAALNYGHRPHGSNFTYGSSHMVLSDKFKVNALYYAGDTFMHSDASKQVAFGMLGALVAWAGEPLLENMIQSCYFRARLPDTNSAALLIEAHLFTEVSFTGNVQEMVLDAPVGSQIHDNARAFCKKHGIKLITVGPV